MDSDEKKNTDAEFYADLFQKPENDAVKLAKQYLNRIEFAQSFVVVAMYPNKIDVVTSGDLFQVSGLLKIAEAQAMDKFKSITSRSNLK